MSAIHGLDSDIVCNTNNTDNTDNTDIVMGLDEDVKKEYITLHHEFGMKYDVPFKCLQICKSGYINSVIENDSDAITNGIRINKLQDSVGVSTEEELGGFKFIIKYIKMHKTDAEIPHPEPPIAVHKLTEWMKNPDEKKIFGKYVSETDDTKIRTNIKELIIISLYANWLDMNVLLRKVCALMGNYIRNKSNDEARRLMRPKEGDGLVAFAE